MELGGSQQPVGGYDLGWELVGGVAGHAPSLLLIKSVIKSKRRDERLEKPSREGIGGRLDAPTPPS
jgi:hypothetical protein